MYSSRSEVKEASASSKTNPAVKAVIILGGVSLDP